MIEYNNLIFLFTTIIILLVIVNRLNILPNDTGNYHQKFSSKKKVPLVGGIIFFIFLLIINKYFLLTFLIFVFLFLCIGIYSDIKKNFSPKLRLFIQFLLSILFVEILNLSVVDIRITFLNNILDIPIFSLIFTAFCITILINGSNFIDGNNTLLIGYYFLITLFLILYGDNFLDQLLLHNLMLALIVLVIFNFFEKLFMGDSGAYVLSVLYSFLLINFYNLSNVSPYYLVLLLWYPAFENLFSILRKIINKKSPISADTNHLHQLLFIFLKNKNQINDLFNNNLTSIIINLYNLISLMIGSLARYQTKYLILLIFINITLYLLSYYYLAKFKNKFK